MSTEDTAFCINCGEEIPAEAEICPECSSSQSPEDLSNSDESTGGEHSGFTSWAIGFKPGSTGRNIIVGIIYLLFLSIGIWVLAYAYFREYPEKLKYAAWVWGGLLMLAALGAFADGSVRGIIAGVVALVLGLLFLPIVREKLSIGSPPGISEGNTNRRNVLTGIGYGVGSMIAVGAILPETESSETGGTGSDGTSSDVGGGDSSESEEQYPNAWYYDESTGIVLESTPEAEADSIGSLYIRGTATNESGQDYEYVQIEFDVLDSSGSKIADALDNTSGLSADQSWRYEALGTGAENADSYELSDITAY